MLRTIVAVVVSYIVMSIIIFAVFAALMFGMGPDKLLEPGSWKGTTFLNIVAPSITVISGLFGGWLSVKIGASRKPVVPLAVVVLLLGAVTAYFTMQKPAPTGERPAGMAMEEFMEKGREPTWLLIFNPIGGAAAVMIGGFLAKSKQLPDHKGVV
ncbi:MAG: hypothetical protein KGS45_13235 [Planctomycetes bacterium]|nr:hypothetical protein [Planctomycetota bacterium]